VVLANRIAKTFNVKMSLIDIFNRPTVRQLSGYIDARQWAGNRSQADVPEKNRVVI
jgi:hypothetical protein